MILNSKKIILIILDGWGIAPPSSGNAITLAKTPYYDYLINNFASTILEASGLSVGLPRGQMGNSEVGHLNIGAGRLVYQDITRIDQSILKGDFFSNPALISMLNFVKEKNSSLHLLGLMSDGGVHSSMEHLKALIKLASQHNIQRLFLHAFLDGRDTPPRCALKYIEEIEAYMRELNLGVIATMAGRYYAMDRDNRWDRVEKAYRAIVLGEGEMAANAKEALLNSYNFKNSGDEFVLPSIINGVSGKIQNNDGVIFFNFRPDRGRELTSSLILKNFTDFKRGFVPQIKMLTLTQYQENLPVEIPYRPELVKKTLGEIIAQMNFHQLRIAETEKYPHVTYFFNGGDEKNFPREERIMIPSPKVSTYDLKPEMSAYEVTQKVINEIKQNKYSLIVLNFANPDMVGHTGVLNAAVKAVETIDSCLEKVLKEAKNFGFLPIITADHGNVEEMIDYKNNQPHTAHTTNPVPFILIGEKKYTLRPNGILADIAPTILELMRIPKPSLMQGQSLLN
ncbi:MAG: 2,3-bisphosphoglycerate-independent phosphoglycerate mutase [Armatimonadetes bacterium]|nr:2,3-bisphosphoglycerate-independent phosphoglycerate mutase [Armatimonadota bacterium]